MVLPASSIPPLAPVNGGFASSAGAGANRLPAADAAGPADAATTVTDRDPGSFRRMPASTEPEADAGADTGRIARENEALTLRRILDLRARLDAGELVELPVPVTEILRISLRSASVDPLAERNARSLYEGMQGVFSASSPPVEAVGSRAA